MNPMEFDVPPNGAPPAPTNLLLAPVTPTITEVMNRVLDMYEREIEGTAIAQTRSNAPIARPGCPTQCGNLTVPYPFGIVDPLDGTGIGSQCALDLGFQIFCESFSGQALPIFMGWNGLGLLRPPLPPPPPRPPSLSPENKITTVGCDDTLVISQGTNIISTCTSTCSNASQVPLNGTCSGTGCCQLPLPKGSNKVYNISTVSASNHTRVWSFNPCSQTFLGDTSRFRFLGASDLSNPDFTWRISETVPVVLDWAIGVMSCKEAQNSSGYACQANSHCVDSDTGYGGYRCQCNYGYKGNPYLTQGCVIGLDRPIGNLSCSKAQKRSGYACQANSHCVDSNTGKGGYFCSCDDGYEGNPYLSPGCADIDECKYPENNTCILQCNNFPGGFNCSCLEGYYGDGIGLGIFALAVVATSLCYIIKKKNRAKMRLKFFEQNGGFLLKQRITSSEGDNDGADVTKIYSAKELTEATNNYAQDMILGREKKPVSLNLSEEEDPNLSAFFVRSMNENRLFQILVPRLVKEGTLDQLQRTAELVKRCLQLKGEDRPKMKEVASELESIRKSSWAEPSCFVLAEDEASDLYAVPNSP
nr:wall-associated receptor kinase 2-like [Ipomoea trifida]